MENLLLLKRFKLSKRKFNGRFAKYYPTGITKNENLDIGENIIIVGEPIGSGDNALINVARYNTIDKTITVFFKDLTQNS